MEPTTLRLPDELARAADRIAERRGLTRSEVIREALAEYCREAGKPTRRGRVELLAALVRYPGSGVGDLAVRAEDLLRKRFRERRRSSR